MRRLPNPVRTRRTATQNARRPRRALGTRLRGSIRRIPTGAYRAAQITAEALGFHLLRKHFYSPIPNLRRLPADVWERRTPMRGIDFAPQRQLAYLETELGPYIAEFDPPLEPPGPPGAFYVRNPLYKSIDAEVLYAIIRLHRPRRILELGSGYSTLVSAAACRANERDGHPLELRSNDPYPLAVLEGLEGLSSLSKRGATEVPPSEFEALGESDILFVDTTHTVKLGGDVNYLVLDVLPALAPGVIVHIHDIFLPWDYPYEWVARQRRFWTEQYLVQAFLALNPDYEIVLAAQALARLYPDRLAKLIPSYDPAEVPLWDSPTAFWIRRTSGS